ncbi:MAG: AAA family ATPase [Syntrophorhabdales bacterium]|jgi:putative ATP-dependent endonuclease of OLD family
MYLSTIKIVNFRGIDSLSLHFHKNFNVIIGENGRYKSTIIDAIRLLYSLGDPQRNIYVGNEDFHTDLWTGEATENMEIAYEFRGLSDKEKGALYEYMVFQPGDEYAAITIIYTRRARQYPKFDYYTGGKSGQKADSNTFDIFQHYYLGALRDSTSDLLRSRENPLGRVIHRTVQRNETEASYTEIMKQANDALLVKKEVAATKKSINTNLFDIHRDTRPIDLHIEPQKADYIVNAIKPFLPFSAPREPGQGLTLRQNSLGHNNLVYIATVLSDMQDRVDTDDIIHFVLLIEEPEAHLHPQLQLNLYDFLKKKNSSEKCQLFVTTHSPTVTSRVEFDNMFIVGAKSVTCPSQCFSGREPEGLKDNDVHLTESLYSAKKKMLERYIDVTKSQLFFARAVLMVEGISEELLFSAFAEVEGFRLEERDIELVQTGTSFYPFLHLFNSTSESKRLEHRVAVVTDDDRFTDSKKSDYAFSKLIEGNYALLNILYESLENGHECTRIKNLEHTRNGREAIKVCKAYKTLEYEIALANVPADKVAFGNNRFTKYIQDTNADEFLSIETYLTRCEGTLDMPTRKKIAILLWKLMPTKSEFAQDFARHLYENIDAAKADFKVPEYIRGAFNHVKG